MNLSLLILLTKFCTMFNLIFRIHWHNMAAAGQKLRWEFRETNRKGRKKLDTGESEWVERLHTKR